MRRILLATTVVAALAATGVTVAATPESGKVSKSAPLVKWSGQTTSGAIQEQAWAQDPSASCSQPTCDTFALEVVDGGGDLQVRLFVQAAPAAGGDGNGSIRVTDPAGKQTVLTGPSGEKLALKVTVKNAPAGKYVVDVSDGYLCCGGPTDYLAEAGLTFAGSAPAPAGTPAGGAPAPAPTAAPSPGSTTTSMTVKGATVSAKKVNKAKKVFATVTTNGPVSNVNVVFAKGAKKLGSAKAPSVNGTAKIAVKFKGKLKPGTYSFAVGGTDASGKPVQAGAKFKIKK